jgi:hypothetical protein
VVSQAVLGITREELKKKRLPLFQALFDYNKEQEKKTN